MSNGHNGPSEGEWLTGQAVSHYHCSEHHKKKIHGTQESAS